jgi:hypothetical protein
MRLFRLRIRIDPRAKKLTKIETLSKWPLYLLRRFLWHISIINIKYIFHVKIQLFVTAKSDHDLDPDPHWFGSLVPDLNPH